MFNSANILERLRNGETPEDIANEMTNALNKAQDELKAEKAKAAQEQEKEERLDALAARIAHDVNEYLEAAIGTKLVDEERMTGREVRELADGLAPLMDLVKDLKVSVSETPHSKTVKVSSPSIKVKSPEDVFAKFFKELGL